MLSLVCQVLNDATEKVKLKSCYALEAFCENLGDDILPFLQPLLERLTQLLQNSGHETQQSAISAIASVALAAGPEFRPYYSHVFGFMRVLMQQTGEQEVLLRARAMELLGVMNLAVGRAHCEATLPECTSAALAGLSLDVPELKDSTYGFFGQLAELIGGESASAHTRSANHLWAIPSHPCYMPALLPSPTVLADPDGVSPRRNRACRSRAAARSDHAKSPRVARCGGCGANRQR